MPYFKWADFTLSLLLAAFKVGNFTSCICSQFMFHICFSINMLQVALLCLYHIIKIGRDLLHGSYHRPYLLICRAAQNELTIP